MSESAVVSTKESGFDDKGTAAAPPHKENMSVCRDALEAIRAHYRTKHNLADKRIRFLEAEFLKSDEDKVYWRSRYDFLMATSQNIFKRNQRTVELDNRKNEINYLDAKIRRLERCRMQMQKGTLESSNSASSSPGCRGSKAETSFVTPRVCINDEDTKLLISTREKQLERLAIQLDGLNSLCQQQTEMIEELQQKERSNKEKVMNLNEKLQRQKTEIDSLARKVAIVEKSADYQKSLASSESGSSPGGPLTGISSLTSTGTSSSSRGGLFLFRLPPRPAVTIDEAGLANFLSELRAEVNQLALYQHCDDCEVRLKERPPP